MYNMYQRAIDVLNASNISGIVNGMVEAIVELKNNGFSGEGLQTHPILQLYAAKLIEMTGMGLADQDRFGEAYHICQERSKILAQEIS